MTDEQSEAEDPQPPAQDPEDGRPPLTRSEQRRVLAGVCGGLGRHLDIDPVIFRVVIAVLCLTGGLGLFLYGLAWLIVPTEEPDGKHGRTELQRVLTGRVDGQSIGAVLLTVIGTGVFFSWMGSGDSAFPLLLLGAMIFLAVRYDPERRRRAAGQGSPPRPGGPYDRSTEQAAQATQAIRAAQDQAAQALSALADWKTWRADFHSEWTARRTGFHEKLNLAKEEGAPQDTPPPGPSGYLWDPRHPERNPYESRAEARTDGRTDGRADSRTEARYESPYTAQPWWQRTDLPTGDPLRKSAGAPAPPPPPAPVACRRRPRSFLAPLGLLLSVGAAAAVWSGSERHSTTVLLSTVLATALIGLGLTVMLGAKFGRARVLALPALLITLMLSALGNSGTPVDSAIGDHSWAPTSAAAVQPGYALGLGDLTLDLSAVDPAGGTVTTSAKAGAGDVHVTVPPDVDVILTVRSVAGDVTLPTGTVGGGLGTDRTVQLPPAPGQQSKGTIDLSIEVGLGDVRVVQA